MCFYFQGLILDPKTIGLFKITGISPNRFCSKILQSCHVFYQPFFICQLLSVACAVNVQLGLL